MSFAYRSSSQPRSLILLSTKLLHELPQPDDFLVFLTQNAEQDGIEWQGMRGIGSRGQVLAGRSEEVVQHELVTAAQGAAEFGEGRLLVEECLGDGGKCAAHARKGMAG